MSDASGEYEVYVQDLSKPYTDAVKVTSGNNTYIFNLKWNYSGTKLLWNNKEHYLLMTDVANKTADTIAYAPFGTINYFDWAPDDKWISYTKKIDHYNDQVYLYNLAEKMKYPVNHPWNDSWAPAFSNDGQYLVFTSGVEYNPTFSEKELEAIYINTGKLMLATLNPDIPNPFIVKSPETEKPQNQDNKEDKNDKKKNKEEADKAININPKGIQERVFAVPVEAGSYRNIYCINGKIYYQRVKSGSDAKTYMYDLAKMEETEIAGDIAYQFSADRKKMMVKQGGDFSIIDVPTSKISTDESLNTGHMDVWIDYDAEWNQIFDEAWRQMRDFFYVKNMHGRDWEALHHKYSVFLPYVQHKNDLTYIIGEMIAELNVGHAYVNAGDRPDVKKVKTGLLGAELDRHQPTGYYRIDSILPGVSWDKSLQSPLKAHGNKINQGDFILAIDGTPVNKSDNIYTLLAGKANQNILLTINDKPNFEGASDYIVKPLEDESQLYYHQWVQNNIKKVSEATNNRVGYIHVPNMVTQGLNEFFRHYYPQLNKEALIIDDRGNGGGFVSPILVDRLNEEIIRAAARRNITKPSKVPSTSFPGPKVLLINKYSASDGDLFAYAFKELGIGTVIGTRTWGGVVGIYGSLPFMDGTDLRKPEVATMSIDEGSWIIEGYGVEPDIYIDNNPYLEYKGEDAQLQKAIDTILEQLETQPFEMPEVPDAPEK